MLVTDLLISLIRIFFIVLSALTVLQYLRHRDRIRRDIALVFVALASSTIINVFLQITGLQPSPFSSLLGQIGVVSQPFLLLRLVAYFRKIPHAIWWVALIGWIISIIALTLFRAPLPLGVTLPVIIYFIAINGYAVWAFIWGAFSSVGIARHRLRFLAAGSSFLILVLVIAGIRLANPTLWPNISPLVQTGVMLTVITYYLGFAPPRWLRQGWQFAELRNYLLRDLTALPAPSASGVMSQLRQAVIQAVGADKVVMAVWDRDHQRFTLGESADSAVLRDTNLNEGLFKTASQQSEPTIARRNTTQDTDVAQLMQKLKAEMLFIVPLVTKDGPVGLLLVFLEYGSLFVDDDLNLLTIFAQQTAMLLENFTVMDEQRRYAQTLETTVQQRTEALQRSNVELRQFAYIASHDLQEPLRMIVSYLQLIESRYINQLDSDAREFIEYAVDGAKRMKSLIEGLLAYSRVETQVQNFTAVNLDDVLNEVRKLLEVAIDEKAATVSNEPLPQVNANESMIVQLFQNLIGNALKYQPKGNKPDIRVGVKRQGNEWIFSVKDNGIGIEAKDLDRIFIIFQRLHSRGEYPGTGIGLAICKKVVEHHGGRIWVESAYGAGTTFYFTLPAAA